MNVSSDGAPSPPLYFELPTQLQAAADAADAAAAFIKACADD